MIVTFNSLSKDVQRKIVDKLLNDLKLRLAEEYYSVKFSDSLKDYVLEMGYTPQYGARPIKRFIQHDIETIIAKKIIDEEMRPNVSYLVDYKNKNIVIGEIKN